MNLNQDRCFTHIYTLNYKITEQNSFKNILQVLQTDPFTQSLINTMKLIYWIYFIIKYNLGQNNIF